MQCPQIATGAVIASFEQRTVSRLAALLCRKSPDNFCYPALDALDIPREPEWQVPCLRRYRAMRCAPFLPRLRNPLSNRRKQLQYLGSELSCFGAVFSHNERPKNFMCGVSRRNDQSQGVALITDVRRPSASDGAIEARQGARAVDLGHNLVKCSLVAWSIRAPTVHRKFHFRAARFVARSGLICWGILARSFEIDCWFNLGSSLATNLRNIQAALFCVAGNT